MASLLFPDCSVDPTGRDHTLYMADKSEGGQEELKGFPDPTETWRLRKPSVLSGKHSVTPWALRDIRGWDLQCKNLLPPLGTFPILPREGGYLDFYVNHTLPEVLKCGNNISAIVPFYFLKQGFSQGGL